MEFYDFAAGGPRPCRAVLGTFDGMHTGHRALFARAKALCAEDGLALGAVVIERESGVRLCSLDERLALIRSCGADFVFLFRLQQIRGLSCGDFARRLREDCRVRACVCGYNFRFGKDRAGGPEALNTEFPVVVLPAVMAEDGPVSSTRIKEYLESGQARKAAALLGRPYAMAGEVEHGRALGGTLGFPTANVRFPAGLVLPAKGVYVTSVRILGAPAVPAADASPSGAFYTAAPAAEAPAAGVSVPETSAGEAPAVGAAAVGAFYTVAPAAKAPAAGDSVPETSAGEAPDIEAAAVGAAVYRAITNVGTRPTVGGSQFRAESFLFDFSGDLYGRRIETAFLYRLRGEMKFDTLEALKAQIQSDVEKARND